MASIQIAFNATVAKLINPSREVKVEVQQILSYQVEGAEMSLAFKQRKWNGRSSFLAFTTGLFPAGFVTLVTAHLKRRGYDVQLVRKPLPAPLGPERPVVDAFPEDPRYDYQPLVVERLVKHGAGIARVATGGGKSRIAKLCVARIGRPTLFLTTRGILMYQMAKSFKELGRKVGIVGDSEWLPQPEGVTCGMVQTLVARLKDPDETWDAERKAAHEARKAITINYLHTVEFVIGEEAHEASGNSYYEILQHCRKANFRLALTATPFMKDDAEANMRLHAAFGPILIKVSEELLIKRGILAKPIFKFVPMLTVGKPAKLYRSTPWDGARRIGIVENEFRNRAIIYEAKRAVQYGLPVMILVTQKAHGAALNAMLTLEGVRSAYIFGESDQDERQKQLNRLASGKNQVLIGSTILDVGVDVPAIGMVILAGGGKAEVALRQRIGRGAREKKDGSPNQFFVVDFADDFNSHLKRHYLTRREIIESTPGFVEGILPANADFDFTPYMKKAA